MSFLFLWGSVYSQNDLQVGYVVLRGDQGSRVPVASALFSYRNQQGILVTEAGIGAVQTIRRGRIFVDQTGTQTGLALANPGSQGAVILFILRGPDGEEIDRSSLPLGPRQHMARFVHEDELFPQIAQGFTGSLTFEVTSGEPVAAVTLRQSVNAHGEPILATLPVVDLGSPATTEDSLIFPHIGAGGILSTQLILISRSSQSTSGHIRLVGSDGKPLQLQMNGESGSDFPYQLDADGTLKATLTNPSGIRQGYAVVSAQDGLLPSGTAVFQFRDTAGRIVSEAGVGAISPTTAARIFVDTVDTQTGVAIASPNGSARVTFELTDKNGFTVSSTQQELPSNGHTSVFVDAIFNQLPPGFTGVLEVRSETPVVPITLKLTGNARGDLILTTLPIADLTRLPESSDLILPQVGFGPGFSTRLILINGDTDQPASGQITFTRSTGADMILPILGQESSRYDYTVPGGGGRQLRPGNSAAVSRILVDPAEAGAREIPLNQGNSLRLRPIAVDSEGELRDDFEYEFASLDPAIASVDELGKVLGNQAGFVTIAVSSLGVVETVTVTVVDLRSGVSGLDITGITQDSGGRLYLASAMNHGVLLAASLDSEPAPYAGTQGTPGFRDDLRLQALFNQPSYLALDQAGATLYVSDAANHTVRKVDPGPAGKVVTLAGTGQLGHTDGPVEQARFNFPMGVALDDRGHLWVCDRGNHVVRRIDLHSGTVETIAGKPASPGFSDGSGASARFNSPVGIAFEPEPLAQQLQRELRSEPPPPVRVIVADSGNGAIRRLSEDGTVETIETVGFSAASRKIRTHSASNPLQFVSPTDIAIDAFGNLYVSEPESNEVLVALQDGSVVSAAQTGTFVGPRGIAVTGSGQLVVAEAGRPVRQVRYGNPTISAIQPAQADNTGGEIITVRGSNFAPDSLVILAGIVLSPEIEDTRTLTFQAPALPSGRVTLTVQNRGGLAQGSLFVDAVPLADLAPGMITTVAGGSSFVGDGGPAELAALCFPEGLTLDAAGKVYIGDTCNHRIRSVNPSTGLIHTVAGNGFPGLSGDGGLANAASLYTPGGLAVGPAGNLFLADRVNGRIRRVDSSSGVITTVAGGGPVAFPPGDGLPATQAYLALPEALDFDQVGDLFIADRGNGRIRRVDAFSGMIATVAGNGFFGYGGDNVPATQTSLSLPNGIAVDGEGSLYIADTLSHRIRKVQASTGLIETIAGTGTAGFSGDGGPATRAALDSPEQVVLDSAGNIYFSDRGNNRIRKIDSISGVIQTAAGNGVLDSTGDGGPGVHAAIARPSGIAVDGAGNLLIADSGGGRVRHVDAVSGLIWTLAGAGEANFPGDGGPATAAGLNSPFGLALADQGNSLLVAETGNNRIRLVDLQTGTIETLAGTGFFGSSSGEGEAKKTPLGVPWAVTTDSTGDIYLVENFNHRIRKVIRDTGTIVAVAGTGFAGFSGDNGPATEAQINGPAGIAVDDRGDIYFSDSENHRIRRIDGDTGVIDTVAGSGCDPLVDECALGDGGQAREASLNRPVDLQILGESLWIADSGHRRVRRIDLTTGIIDTVAGNGSSGSSGDGGSAASAAIGFPLGIAIDTAGNLFVADNLHHRIRKVDAVTGIISTVGGKGDPGFSGDNGPASDASFAFPRGLAVDGKGNLFVADSFNGRIRAIRGSLP